MYLVNNLDMKKSNYTSLTALIVVLKAKSTQQRRLFSTSFARSIFGSMLLLLVAQSSVLAQTFTGNIGSEIPGTTAGYYCTNSGSSSAAIALDGRIGTHYTITQVNVGLTHEQPSELQLSLISPRGKVLNLSIGNGGSVDNAYAATVFMDGTGEIASSMPPFNGFFTPQGGELNSFFNGEVVAGNWRLEVCDFVNNNNDGIINSFSIVLAATGAVAPPNPVYEVNVASINNINITLDADCQRLLIPRMVLSGNFDQDGDGNEPPSDAFVLTINDGNTCNGPVLDGCGDYEFWISAAPTVPSIQRGFANCTGGQNILNVTQVPNPNSGQQASVTINPDTITLRTRGGNVNTTALFAQASYVFPRAGTTGFRINFSSSLPAGTVLDIFRVRAGNVMMPVVTDYNASGIYTFAQPIEVAAGDLLQFELRNPNGSSPAGATPSIVKIYDFFFQPSVPDFPVTGILPLGGFIRATDATPVQFITVPTSPLGLFTSQLNDVLITNLNPNIARSYQVNGRTGSVIPGTLHPALRDRLLAGGGLPLVFDACSDVNIIVSDQISSAGECQDIIVTRTFAAREIAGSCPMGESMPPLVLASYQIVFNRASLSDVIAPDAVVEIDCSNFNGTANPQPLLINYPRLQLGSGQPFYLNQPYDNLGVTFTDGPRINICTNTYKFVRTFTVIDWCDVSNILTFNQLVKVGDFSSPMIVVPTQDLDFDGIPDEGPLFYSTNSIDCSAFIDIVGGVIVNDNCSTVTSLVGFIYLNGDLSSSPLGPFTGQSIANNIPLGTHLIRYIATDDCGNEDIVDVPFQVGDASGPVAKCEDGLNISLGGNGTAIVYAEDIDVNSYDDCTPSNLLLLEVVRLDANDNPIGNWGPSVTLNCNDLGMLRIGLRVTDDANRNGTPEPGIDNSNTCFTDILVEDVLIPVCIAPNSVAVTCSDLDANFPQDLDAAFAQDPEGTRNLLNDLFGRPTGVDNCPGNTVSQTVTDNRTSCGSGTIIRSFNVRDAQNLSSQPNCRQTITVINNFDYAISFPADRTSQECLEPNYNGVVVYEGNCDLITTSMFVDTFQATANECYVLRVTYEVINLCEFSTLGDPYVIPRDADQDGIVGEQVILAITPGPSNATINDDIAILDNDLNRFNGYINELDTHDGGLVPGGNNFGYGRDNSRGYFLYRQFIAVFDNNAPEINLANSNQIAYDDLNSCRANYTTQFAIEDECSMAGVTVRVELDLYALDVNGDDIFSANEFVPTRTLNNNELVFTGDGNFRINLTSVPLGHHALRVRASDGCGNTDIGILEFDIIDRSTPGITCINGLAAELSATESGGGIAEVRAKKFVVDIDNLVDCSGPLTWSVYRIADTQLAGFQPNAADSILTVFCDDFGLLEVRVYVIDPLGNFTYCETTLDVQANLPNTCGSGNTGGGPDLAGLITGEIFTPGYEMREGVEVNVTASTMGGFTTYTSQHGIFTFQHLLVGDDYTIQPRANPAIDLGQVTTGDLILISRHILGLQAFSSPYQYVAADVTADRQINVLDMIAIRRVILGITTDYPSSDSWRFMAENGSFGNDPSRWLNNSALMEVFNVNNLENQILNANFMAIEMGNVSAAVPGNSLEAPAQQRSGQALNIPLLSVENAKTYAVAFYQPEDMLGFQTTLELAPELELLDIEYGTATEGDFNLHHLANGLLGIAHVSSAEQARPLFTLHIRSMTSGQLSDFIQLSSRLVTNEAYQARATANIRTTLNLVFHEEAADAGAEDSVSANATEETLQLAQNRPNPFREATSIDFQLPEASLVTLTIYDLQGRVLLARKIQAQKGENTEVVRRTELGTASGLLTYTLDSPMGRLTRKMLATN